MIKRALPLFIIATCIVGIFADEFCEKQRKLDSECAKYCYQVAKPLLQMAPVCHQKDAEIANLQKELDVFKQQEKKSFEEENKYNVLNDKFIELNKKLAVYEDRGRKSLEEGTKRNELNSKLDHLQDTLVAYGEREGKSKEEENKYNNLNEKFIELNKKLGAYEERDRKSLEEGNKYNELNDKFIKLREKLAVYEYRESKGFEEGTIELKTKISNLQNDLDFYKEQERKSLEEENKYNEFNVTLAKHPKILSNLEEREKNGIEEMNKSKELNVQLGEVQGKLADCEEREKKGIEEINLNKKVNVQLQAKLADCEELEKTSKENNSKAESSLNTSLEEYRVKLSNLESSYLALNISIQKLKKDVEQCNKYIKTYNSTCSKPWPGVDTNRIVEIEGMEQFSVRCVNDLNSGPGWMIIQEKPDKLFNIFYHHKNWSEYRNGFSDVHGHFFIGLEKLYRLTNAVPHELYIDMEEWDGNKKFAHYDNFRVGNESEQYPLKDLGNYTSDSNAGDALRDNNNMKFSTQERDNDNSPDIHCAEKYYSGWWHNNCTKANLNGWQYETNQYLEDGIWWFSHVKLKKVRMLIRPKVKK